MKILFYIRWVIMQVEIIVQIKSESNNIIKLFGET